MNFSISRFYLRIAPLFLFPLFSLAQTVPIIITDDRRAEFVSDLDLLLHYEDERFSGEIILAADPFRFERILPSLTETQRVGDVPMATVLERIGTRLSASVTGFQEFGGRPFLATRDFGLLRNGQMLTLRVPDVPGEEIAVRIENINRDNFTITHQEEELVVPLGADPRGIRRTNR